MNSAHELSRLYSALGDRRSSLVRDKISSLLVNENVVAIFVHGSFSRGQADELSDLDIIAIIKDCAIDEEITVFRYMLEMDNAVAVHAHTNRFPWFGHLEAVIYPGPNWFSLEIGFVAESRLGFFYVEPDAWIIKDSNSIVHRRREECLADRIEEMHIEKSNFGYELLNLGIKFNKSIKRQHLWNAHNYCSIARRMLFDIKRRGKYGDAKIFVGVPERRIESELDSDDISKFRMSAPCYCAKELTAAFIFLFDSIIEYIHHDMSDELITWLGMWRAQYAKAEKQSDACN